MIPSLIPPPASLSSLFAKSFPGAWGPLASALANHLWQSTLFAAVAALLTLALKNNRAHVRCWLWLAASAKFLFPFSLLIVLGTHLAWLHPSAKHAAAANAGTYFVMQEVSQPFDLAALADAPAIPAAPVPSRIARLRAALGGSFFPTALAAIWLAGFLFVLARWLRRWWKIVAVIRNAPTLIDGREADALRRMAHLAGLKRSIPLKSLPIAIEPGIFGLFRPVLLWPEGISSHLDDAQLESILAHELCHVRRRDNLTAALHMAVESIFWFHPLVWWIETRLITERETACDEDVLALLGHARASARAYARVYAESILKVCEFSIVSPLPCVSGVTGADLRHRIAAIVTGRALARTSWPQKLLLAAAAISVLAAPIVQGMSGLVAQSPPTRVAGHALSIATSAKLPEWDAVSVKQSDTQKCQGMGMGKTADAVDISCVPPVFLIQEAYGITETNRIVGAPDWAKDAARYDIHAKVAGKDAAAFDKLSHEEMDPMLQMLLAESFHLKVHMEKRDMPVYDLVIAKGAPKMKQATAQESSKEAQLMGGRGRIEATGAPIKSLPFLLSNEAGRPVVDKTGLTGKYDFTLEYTPVSRAATDETGGMSIFTALQDQLGLKLEPRKEPMDVLVIDHIEKPTVDGAEVTPTTSTVPATMAEERATTPLNGASAPAASLKFDAVSIRRNVSGSREMSRQSASNSDSIAMTNVPLALIVYYAYWINDPSLVQGIPDWAMTERYDIAAKVDPSELPAYHVLTSRQRAAMLQPVLADRFGLRAQRDMKDRPVYALVTAKGGPRLKETLPGASHPNAEKANPNAFQKGSTIFATGGNQITGEAATASDLAVSLSTRGSEALGLGRPIVDKTGLNGRYDFVLNLPAPDVNTATATEEQQDTAASLSDALQNQLGLKLQPSTAPTETLVIDHIERPSEN